MSRVTASQRVPCAKCPWRRDADPAYWHPGEFERMTEVIRNRDPFGAGVMLCHKSPRLTGESMRGPNEPKSPLSGTLAEPALCAGFVAVIGYDSIALRVWSLTNRDLGDITEVVTSGGLPLYDSLDEMNEAVAEANLRRSP